MTNSVEYIIKLVADDSELKRKLSAGELLSKSEMAKVKQLLTSAISSADREAKNLSKDLRAGLDVDTTQLEKTLKFISGIFSELEKTQNTIKDWAKTGKGVYSAFEKMQTSVASLAQNVATLQTGLNTLTESFSEFKTSYQSFDPAKFAGVAQVFQTVNHGAKETIRTMVNVEDALDTITKRSQHTKSRLKEVFAFLNESEYSFEFSDDLDADLENALGDLEDVKKSIAKYTEKLKADPYNVNLRHQLKEAKLGAAEFSLVLLDIDEKMTSLGKKSIFGNQTKLSASVLEQDILSIFSELSKDETVFADRLQQDLQKASSLVDKFQEDLQKALDKASKIQIDLTLPEYSTFLPKINEFVAKLNAKSDSFAKVELKPILVGEVQTPTILPTSDEKKEKKKSKKANVTLTPVDNVKAKISQEIAKLEAAREAQQQAYDALEEQHQKNREENPRNTTAGRQMNKILPVIQQYEQAIEHYKKLQELMNDPESAQTIASEWNKNQVGLSTLGAKQDAILAKTEEWRLKMITALSLSAKDLDFDFTDAKPGEALYREIERYFEDNPINVTVNARGLAEQIKTVLDTEGISIGSGGGVATIDPKTLGPMIGSIVNSVLTGAAMPTFGGDDSVEDVDEVPVAESTEEAAESTRKYVKTLDEIPAHVDELVQSVMNFAKIAKAQDKVNSDGTVTTARIPKGVKNAAKWLEGKGIRVSEITEDTSVEQVKQMIQDALLTQGKDGYASGSYFADALRQVIEDPKSGIDTSKKNGQIIERLRQDIAELLKMGQVKQETESQWFARQNGVSVANEAIGSGRALIALNSVRGRKNSKNIPGVENIQRAIDIFTERGLDTENLELLKIAREELGDSKDEQAIAKFKQYYEEFREETRGILETLNLLFGDFKGRVSVKGRKYDISELYDVKRLPKGDITDAEVYSYLESKEIDKSFVGSSARREQNWRKALREERRLLRSQAYASERAPYLSAMPDSFKSKKTSILDHEVTVSPFTPKSDILTPEVVVDLERSITSAQQKIEANQAALQENEARLQQLDAEIVKQKAIVEQAKQSVASVSETRAPIDQTKLQQAFDQQAFLQTVVTRGEQQGGILNVVNEFLALKEKEKKLEAEISELRAKGKGKDTIAKKEKELSTLQKQLSIADVGAAYPEIVEQSQKLNAIIKQREELQEKLRIIDGLTVQDAKKRLVAWKKDEETVKRYKENPDSLKLLTKEEQERIRGLDETIARREPNKKLYLHYIKNPDLVKTTLSDKIASLAAKEASQKSAFVEWAKAEAAKLPEATAEIAKAAKPVVAQFKEQMDSLYAEAMNTKDKLKDKNLSDDDRSALVGHLQNTLVFLKEVEEEYNRIAKKIGGDEFLLGKVKRQNIERLTKTYIKEQPSVVDERKEALSRAESDLAWTEQARKKAETERKSLETEKEAQKIFVERIAKQKELQTLEEQERQLVAEVQALENDGASTKKIEKKKQALEEVRSTLSQIKAELDKFGGVIAGKEAKQTPIDQIQTHAIDKAKEYQQNIIDLTAQKYAADYKLKEIDERQDDIKKYKLGAGEGKSALEKTKRNWINEFMRSDYVVSAEQALREKTKTALIEAEQESRKIFDAKVVEAMQRQGLNPADKEETKKFLKSKQGRQLSANFASEVDTNAQNIWSQYESYKKDLHDRLLKDFTDSFKLDSKGALSATFKTQSEDGKFVDDVRVENVLKDLLSKLEEEKKELKSKYKVKEIESKIKFAEEQKKAAMESVGLTDEQVLSSEVVKEQIKLRQQKFDAEQRLAKQQEELNALQEGALKGDTKAVNAAKKKVAQTNEEIARYDVLIANRDKLIALNAKEKEGVELSAEERRIVATDKLVKLQDKLEKSKQRVITLEQQYDEAKGTDKAAVALRNLNKEKEKQLNLEKAVKGVERSVGYWTKQTGKAAETEAVSSEGGTTPITGGVLGAITNVIKESLSGVTGDVKIDTSHLATEETLSAILALLGGDGDWEPEEESKDTNLSRNIKKSGIEIFDEYFKWKYPKLNYKSIRSTSQPEIDRLLNQIYKNDPSMGYMKRAQFTTAQYNDEETRTKLYDTYNKVLKLIGYKLGEIKPSETRQADGSPLGYYADIVKVSKDAVANMEQARKILMSESTARVEETKKQVVEEKKKTEEAKKQVSETQKKTSEDKKATDTAKKKNSKNTVPVEPEIKPGAVAQEVKENVAETPAEAEVAPKKKKQSKSHGDGAELSTKDMLAKIQENISLTKNDIKKLDGKITELEGSSDPNDVAEKESLIDVREQFQAKVTSMEQSLKNIENASDDEEQKPSDTQNKSIDKPSTPAGGGGILGVMRSLAKESTLQKVLTALSTIAKNNAMSGKPNNAQGLLEQFRRMLESDAWEGRERVAYMDLATGSMSNSITGDNERISAERLRILREAYANKMDMNAQVHTHANEDDPYFSPEDLKQFGVEFANGITKQILLSKNNLTVLDMTDVKNVNGLLEALTKTEHNFEALAATADKFGAKYVNKAFDALTPQGLVKMLGIKGVESKYTEAETRDSVLKGVAAEDAKEAADMLQESTGRAIKKTVERVGVELQTMTEKTDAKGNKTWSAQLSNKYEKAMLATNQRIAEQGLGDVFGVGTEANKTLLEYTDGFEKLLSLVRQFKENPSEELQTQINALLPTFDKAEEKLISLIARKDKFLGDKEAIAVFGQGDVAQSGASLKALATSRYGSGVGLGGNVAFNGLRETQNGAQLLVDVLKDGSIKQYALEVDRATGQVKEFMLAETALANAFQNVNKAMQQNVKVQAAVAIGDNPTQQEAFMQNAKSSAWNNYKKALADMEKYVAKIWQRMANGGRGASQKELDYIMALSEHVLALGKNVQKTSIDFKNFWENNPENVTGFNIKLKKGKNAPSRDEQVRAAMEKYAQTNAGANNAQYSFASFDNDTLRYKLTDAEGNIRNVSLVWNELYQQVAMISDKSVAALDPLVQKIEDYKQKIIDAKAAGYLFDDSDETFNQAIQQVAELEQKVKDGTASFEELAEARKKAVGIGGGLDKVITSNKRQVGTNAVNSVKAQYSKIVGSRSDSVGVSVEDSELAKQYEAAFKRVTDQYNEYVKTNQINNPQIQENLRQQAAGVQKLGRELLKSTNEAERLQNLVDNSGSFVNKKGELVELGGFKAFSDAEMQNKIAAMRAYAVSMYGAEAASFKLNKRTMTLEGQVRENDYLVHQVGVSWNNAAQGAYAYEIAEKESLSGMPAFLKGLKEKTKAITQYLFSMTSIYRVIGEVRKGIQYIRDIDKALVELRKVTDETEETYDEFLNTAAKTADRLGSTISAVTEATATFAKLGYSMEMASEMAEAAIVYKNVGDNIASTEDAANSIISTLKGFRLEASESMRIVDRFNEVNSCLLIQ